MMNALPPWPSFSAEEADAASRILLSNKVNYWTGEEGRLFEKEFAAFAGTEHAIALANGTVALDLVLYGLGIGAHNGGHASDEVIVTPRTFIASASAVVNAGAVPVFADVDLESQNITPQTVEPHITSRTRAIICVHLAGWPCDMDGFQDLATGRQINLIEDCAQAHGALYKGRPVGGLGDAAAWSFCQDKIMTTGGEGGMVTCNDPDLWRKMWSFKDHGKSFDAVYNRQHPPGFRWLHESIGTNWRLTEMQSAIGRIQLKNMPEWHKQRTANAHSLLRAIEEASSKQPILRVPAINERGSRHAWYKFYAFVKRENLPADCSRDHLITAFNHEGIPCMQGSCSEVYLERAFDGSSARPQTRLPNAQELGGTSLMFLVHPTLKDSHMQQIAGGIAKALAGLESRCSA